jgi:capsular polysaccharide biosynthesis protein
MSQPQRGPRRPLQIVRRHKLLVGIMAVLGLLLGGGYAAFAPVSVTSTALVLLTQTGQNGSSAPGSTGPDPYMVTQEVIAKSTPVLMAALPAARPAMSLTELRRAISIGSEATYIISVTAKEKTGAEAAATANAVAASYIGYVSSAASPDGRVQAQLFQSATPSGAVQGRVKQLVGNVIYVPLGALLGALIGAAVAVAVNRRDRRLRKRDEIANSIRVPVLASFPVDQPVSAANWTRLLAEYEPGAQTALQLRNAIKHLETAAADASPDHEHGSWSVTVLSLSSDPRALALGPQLAVYAAAQGISTALVIGPQQDTKVTAALRAACATPPTSSAASAASGSPGSPAAPGSPGSPAASGSHASPTSSERPGRLELIVSDSGTGTDVPRDVTLAVVVAVVDGRNPQVPATTRTSATLLGVSAGAATADQLARVAISAVSGGREITGILVADPDSDDKTTGRLPQLIRRAPRVMPTRVSRIATEVRR